MRIIDLTGPQGNAFCLMGMARTWGKQLNKNVDAIIDEMMEGDYEHLCGVFEREFGSVATLINKPWEDEDEWEDEE